MAYGPQDGSTALHFASRQGHRECAQLLLNGSANPSAQTQDGNTALMVAAENGRLDLISLLIAHKADARAKNKVSGRLLPKPTGKPLENTAQH